MLLIQLKQKMGVLPPGAVTSSKALGAGQHAEAEDIEVEEIHDEKK
jgi:uncharacterized transporter YbjL